MPSTFQAFAFIAKALKTLSSWYKRAFASFLLDPCERMVCLPTVSICLWLPTKISCTCTNEKATTGSSDDRLPWTRSGISSSDCSRMHPWRRHHLKSCHLPSRRSTCTLLRSAAVSRQTSWWQGDKFPVYERLLVPCQTHDRDREVMQTIALSFQFHSLIVTSSSWLQACFSNCLSVKRVCLAWSNRWTFALDRHGTALNKRIAFRLIVSIERTWHLGIHVRWSSNSVSDGRMLRHFCSSGSACILRPPPLRQLWSHVCLVSCL